MNSTLKRLIQLIAPYRWTFILAVFLTISISLLGIIRPYLIQYIIDFIYPSQDTHKLLNFTLLVIFLLILTALCQYFLKYVASWLSQQVMQNLRQRVYEHTLNLRIQFFDRTPVGNLHTRTISDIETLNSVFSEGFVNIFGELLQLLAVWSIMFYTDWFLTLMVLLILPPLFLVTHLFRIKVKVAFQNVRKKVAELNTFIQEHLVGMQVVQAFHQQANEMKKFHIINNEHRQANIQTIWYYSLYFPAIEIIAALAIAILIGAGSWQIFNHQTTTGTIIAFIIYINMFFRPIRVIADQFNTLQLGVVSAERVFNLLDNSEIIGQDLQPISIEHANKLLSSPPSITFQNVSFAYKSDFPVLNNISFTIQAGTTTAFVGKTGAGKTSIINLISRFYDFQHGNILIQNTDIRKIPLPVLRSHIGVILQDPFLFAGSIFENITLYNDQFSKEHVFLTAELLGLHEWILRLPGGYQFQVGERGHTLSAGQRQLIAFIRVMLLNPTILILDEATANIDPLTEQLIQNALKTLLNQRTAILIAHRLATIQQAHQIIVLNKGSIIESGNHEQLLKFNGHYAKMLMH